jgi:hypothetical protein
MLYRVHLAMNEIYTLLHVLVLSNINILKNCIGGVIVSMLSSSCGRSCVLSAGQFTPKIIRLVFAALRSKNKDWLAWTVVSVS